MQKLISVLVTLSMLLSGGEASLSLYNTISAKAYYIASVICDNNTASAESFEMQLSQLLNEYSGDYYSKIVIDTEENTLKTDENEAVSLDEYGIDYSAVDLGEVAIPAVPVLEATGEEAELTEDGTVETESGREFSLLPEGSTIVGEIKNGYAHAKVDGKNVKAPVAYLNSEQAEENFNLNTQFSSNGTQIIVTNPYQTKRLIVDMKKGKNLNKGYGEVKKITDGDGCYILQFDSEEKTKAAYKKLKKNNSIASVCCDEVVSATEIKDRGGAAVMNSDRYKSYLKSNSKTSKVTVAVVDTGAETSHPFLKGRLVKGYNVYTKKSNVNDDNGHGTHVAGIVADNTPSSVKIMPVKVMDSNGTGTDLSIAAGIDWAVKNNAKVINLSLGGLCTDDNCPIAKALKRANKAGVTVCVAAGNDTNDTKYYCPARFSQCITVAAATNTGGITPFSNYGSAIDVAAPGDMIMSSYIGGKYEKLSGTSMASPFAAAAAAMLISDNSALTPAQVKKALKGICADMGLEGWDKYSGAGLINMGMALGDSCKADDFGMDLPEDLTMSYFKHCTWYMTQLYAKHSEDSISEDASGATYNLVSLSDRTVKTSTSNSKVAYFDGRYIVPKSAGKATIKIWIDGGKTIEIPLTVKKKEVWLDYASKKFAGGKGTKKEPYLISTPQQLAKLSLDVRTGKKYLNKYFKVTKDIDLKGKMWQSIEYISFADFEQTGWIVSDSFNGIFDGGNHKIKNMRVFDDPVQRSWGDTNAVNTVWYSGNLGLFGYLQNCTVKNVGIENGYSISSDTGLLAGDAFQNTAIQNCYTTGECGGAGLVFGVSNYNVHIKNCYSTATVRAGGLICYAYSSRQSGGITISNCYFAGEQLGTSDSSQSGGFAYYFEGQKQERFTNIYNCFSTVNSPSGYGFAEKNIYGNIYGSYYLKGNACGIKSDNSKKRTKLKAKEKSFFKKKGSYTNSKNWNKSFQWDFKNTWAIDKNINGGLPYLKKNKPFKKSIVNTGTGTWLDYAAKSFAGGKGTKKEPYLISNAAQLARITRLYRYGGGYGKHFKLTADISLKAHPWFTIGAGEYQNGGNKYLKKSFYGSIDGAGHTISDMKITDGGNYCGFIAEPAFNYIKNINFENAYVEGGEGVGIICGMQVNNSQITGCNVSGKVKGKRAVGGIGGYADYLYYCRSDAQVTSEYEAGGLAAYLNIVAEGCVFDGTLNCSGEDYSLGGIGAEIGQNTIIKNCASFGEKLYANTYYGEIINSYECIDGTAKLYNYCRGDTENTVQVESKELEDINTFAGWDFEKGWYAPDGAAPLPRPARYVNPINIKSLPTENWKNFKAKSFAGGKGTFADPYIIATAEQLAHLNDVVRHNKMTYFRQVRDIDLDGKLWDSVFDTYYTNVQMNYDGGGHKIKNLKIKNGTGLFPYCLTKGQIANLHIEGVYGNTETAILGWNAGRVVNCSVTGCTIAPPNYKTEIGHYVGGIVAINDGTVECCSFDGTINGGGIAGMNEQGYIQNCFTKGKIISGGNGFTLSSNGTVENCYTVMTGSANNNYSSCFSAADACCYCTFGDENAIKLSNLKRQETFAGWDFDNIWAIDESKNEGLPYLRSPQKRSITYVTNGGTMPKFVNSKYSVGFKQGLTTPTKSGCKLVGWFTDKECTNQIKSVGSTDLGDITVYAKWEAAYTIKFNANLGKGSMSSVIAARNKDFKLPANEFVRKGYIFEGWSKSKDGKTVYKNKQAVKNLAAKGKAVTLYAKWKPVKYTVVFFNANGSMWLGEQKFEYDTPKALKKLNAHAPKGKKFVGWTRVQGGSVEFKPGQKVKNLTDINGVLIHLYAVYK